jgi:predicted CopG family antitoxin
MEPFVTTVKLDDELYTQFKEINVRGKISFQDFVNKCLQKYIDDVEFRNEISEGVCHKLSHNQPFQLSNPHKDKNER